MNSICRITDGTTTVDFLVGTFRLNSWPVKITQAKGGGTWQDSPLVEGRRLVSRVYGNVIEEYDFQVVAGKEDVMIQEVQDFRRLLEKSVAFWTTDWQNEPVWLEVRGQHETNTRYAVVKNWSTPGDADPFSIDFVQDYPPGTVLMTNWLLLVERGQWQGYPPDGTNSCVELSSGTTRGSGTLWMQTITTVGTDDAFVNHTNQSIYAANVVLRAGVLANASYSIGIRFRNVTIPRNSVIRAAVISLVAPANLAGNTCRLLVHGEANDTPAAFSTYEDFISRTRTESVRAFGNMEQNVIAQANYSPIENIIQEIINLPAWNSGDDLVIFIEDNGSDNNAYREWNSRNSGGAHLFLNIYYFTAASVVDVGRSATCDNEVFLTNKHNDVQLTHQYYYDASGPAWSGNLINAALPYAMLPALPAVGDIAYFGVQQYWEGKCGPFTNLVFDLSQGAGTAVGQWEYYNGAGWTILTEIGGTLNDETQLLTSTGVGGVFWSNHDTSNWVEESLNTIFGGAAPNIEAYWFRFNVTAVGGAPTAPTQQSRRLYTTSWPEAEFQATEVTGDFQALSRIKLYNRSARGRFLSSGADANVLTPDLMANRAFVATRSVDRGEDFRLWVNLTHGQRNIFSGGAVGGFHTWHNPDGITINNLNLDTNELWDGQSPIRRSLRFNPAGVAALDERVEILMNGEAAQAYYGSHKCFLRLRQVGGLGGDFTFRVKVRTSTAGMIFQSDLFVLNPKPAAGADENLWLLFDVGRIDLAPSQLLAFGDEMNNLSIVIELGNSNAAPGDLYLLDMAFLPIDEWASDCEDYSESIAGALMSGLTSLRFLDVDSIGNPRRRKRLLIRGDNTTESIQATWVYRSNGISAFQSGATQKIYAIFARYFESGGNSFWDGNPNISSSIQAFTAPRYLSARGAR